jgi:hypothetical protein
MYLFIQIVAGGKGDCPSGIGFAKVSTIPRSAPGLGRWKVSTDFVPLWSTYGLSYELSVFPAKLQIYSFSQESGNPQIIFLTGYNYLLYKKDRTIIHEQFDFNMKCLLNLKFGASFLRKK